LILFTEANIKIVLYHLKFIGGNIIFLLPTLTLILETYNLTQGSIFLLKKEFIFL